MYTILLISLSIVFVQCQRDPTSIENVILARKVINEVNMKELNVSDADPLRNKTMREINEYLKQNAGLRDAVAEDKKDYEEAEEKGLKESKNLEHLMGTGLIPFLYEKCNYSYTVNHVNMYNISLVYDVGNNSVVPYDTNGDKIRVAYMKFQDYVNRMNQWTRRLIKGGALTLRKVERDTFCNLVYKSNYTNTINNSKVILAFENELNEKVDECLKNVDNMFEEHFKKVETALLKNSVYPEYVPIGKNIQENFIKQCNLYEEVRTRYWKFLMADPRNEIYRKSFPDYFRKGLTTGPTPVPIA